MKYIDILKYAYDGILSNIQENRSMNNLYKFNYGRDNPVYLGRIKELDKKCSEILSLIVLEEKKMK